MRIQRWSVLAVAALAAACGGEREPMPAGDGALVLEVGGGQPSLRRALERAGFDVPPPVDLASPGAAQAPAPETDARTQPEAPPSVRRAEGDEAPKPTPTPPRGAAPAAVEPAFTVVTLAEGQTLIHLARKHLGDGNRFREILALNGWSEAESRRLKPGTKVKVPKAGPGRSGGR
ncbi:MAG: LysM peptidoglycan-binding domain-containing protein [Planctomycetota bacterium]